MSDTNTMRTLRKHWALILVFLSRAITAVLGLGLVVALFTPSAETGTLITIGVTIGIGCLGNHPNGCLTNLLPGNGLGR